MLCMHHMQVSTVCPKDEHSVPQRCAAQQVLGGCLQASRSLLQDTQTITGKANISDCPVLQLHSAMCRLRVWVCPLRVRTSSRDRLLSSLSEGLVTLLRLDLIFVVTIARIALYARRAALTTKSVLQVH